MVKTIRPPVSDFYKIILYYSAGTSFAWNFEGFFEFILIGISSHSVILIEIYISISY